MEGDRRVRPTHTPRTHLCRSENPGPTITLLTHALSHLCFPFRSGSFSCIFQNQPSKRDVEKHLQSFGFHVVSCDAKDNVLQAYFCAFQYGTDVCFLCEFVMIFSRRFFQATFKCKVHAALGRASREIPPFAFPMAICSAVSHMAYGRECDCVFDWPGAGSCCRLCHALQPPGALGRREWTRLKQREEQQRHDGQQRKSHDAMTDLVVLREESSRRRRACYCICRTSCLLSINTSSLCLPPSLQPDGLTLNEPCFSERRVD